MTCFTVFIRVYKKASTASTNGFTDNVGDVMNIDIYIDVFISFRISIVFPRPDSGRDKNKFYILPGLKPPLLL